MVQQGGRGKLCKRKQGYLSLDYYKKEALSWLTAAARKSTHVEITQVKGHKEILVPKLPKKERTVPKSVADVIE